MENIKVFGHKNPDMDSIASAVGITHLLKLRDNIEAKAVKLGEFNKEVKFALKYFKISLNMETIENVEDKEKVILVDHNEFTQSVNNIENAKILMVVDHHKIDNFKTKEPLEYIAYPVGCTATILYSMLENVNGLEDSKVNALLLSAIISDTLLFKSPTTTKRDEEAARELAKMLNVNINEYGMELLKAGADLSDLSEEELVNIDAKVFDFNSIKIAVAQINAVDVNSILVRQEKIEVAMQNEIEKLGLDAMMVLVTDIVNCDSIAIALGNRKDIIEKAFGKLNEKNIVVLKGVVSRKKQVAPKLTEAAS